MDLILIKDANGFFSQITEEEFNKRKVAPVEVAPVEVAPVEVAPVEVAPIKKVPIVKPTPLTKKKMVKK